MLIEDTGAPQGLADAEPVENQPEQQQPDPGTETENQQEQEAARQPAEESEADKVARRAAKADALERQLQYERRHARRREADYERRLQERQSPEQRTPENQQRQPEQDVETRALQIAEQRDQERRLLSWGEAGEKDVPDFHDKCNTVAQLVGDRRGEFMSTILDMDDGHKAVAYLADHPEDAMRIFDLPPRRMAIELGKLSAKGFSPAPTPTSKVPPPIKPLAGTSRADDDAKLSDDEWYARWQKANTPKG